MPLPKPNDGESKLDFINRCMSDDKMNEEYPDKEQRFAVCNQQSKMESIETDKKWYDSVQSFINKLFK
jgi:hypothetical protein